MMMTTMAGKSKKMNQRNNNQFNKQSNTRTLWKVLTQFKKQNKRDLIKMFKTESVQRNNTNLRKWKVKNLTLRLSNRKQQYKILNCKKWQKHSGLHQSGSRNGRKLCFYLILKHASHTLTTKRWLIETNLLKKKALSQATKSSISMKIK